MNYNLLTAFIIFAGYLVVPDLVLAQAAYKPLVGIPGVTDPTLNFGDYINALYAFSISIAALLAVIKIIIAGVKYMLSDVVTSKSDAINDIRGSLLGLIIVISAVLVLRVINPQLAETEIFLDPVVTGTTTASTAPAGTVTTAAGYKYAKQGTVANFQAVHCSTAGSVYKVAGGNENCFDPLPASVTTALTAAFVTSAPAGTVFDLPKILERYQTVHFPRIISSTASIKAAEGAVTDWIAVEFTPPLDWLDSANSSAISVTCMEYRRLTGLNTTVVGNATKGYLACVDLP